MFIVRYLRGIIILFIVVILVSCGTERGIVKDEAVKMEAGKVEEPVSKIVKEEEKKTKGKSLYIKEWNALIYKGPSYKSNAIEMVNKGQVLEEMERKKDWVKIRIENGIEGWIPRKESSTNIIIPIIITNRKLTKEEQLKVDEYLKNAEKCFSDQKKAQEEFNRKYANTTKVTYEYLEAQRDIQSYPGRAYYYYNEAYKIDPNNLEAIKGIITSREQIKAPDHSDWSATENELGLIELCNLALALNPPDKEWWYEKIGGYYEGDNENQLALAMYKNAIYELDKKSIQDNELYPLILYKMTFVISDLYEKKSFFERIKNKYPEWYTQNEVDFYYQRLLRQLK